MISVSAKTLYQEVPGDFATKVKQINSQSDLSYMLSFAARLTSQLDPLPISF